MSPRCLDLENYAPFYLSQIANKWSWSSSRLYLEKFGIGVAEWRVMSRLASDPGTSANQICAATGIDKALIGRCLRRLEDLKLAVSRADPTDGRSRSVRLTAAGRKINDQIYELALSREQRLLGGLTKAEVKDLLAKLRRLTENAKQLQAASE